MIILFVLLALLYTYVTVALTYWGVQERPFEIFVVSIAMALWPVFLPIGYLYGTIRLRIKYKKYRGGRYVRKTFNAAAIDEHLAKYGHNDR